MEVNKLTDQLQGFDFNDIDWERVGVWPTLIRMFLFALASLVIVTGAYFFIVKDKYIKFESVQRKETELRGSFESKAFEAANLDSYRKQMIEMEESFGALVSRLPSDTEVPGLLEDIDDKGVESRLSIDSIDLQPEVRTEFHIELPISVKVTGGYHEFGTFVSGVTGMPRIVTLHDFSISESTGSALQMEILAKTYRYKSQED